MNTVMPSTNLKLRTFWLLIGYLLVAIVLYLSLTSNPPVEMNVLFDFEDKVYHALAYFVLMTWFAQIYHNNSQRVIIALLFVVMGLTMEYLQSMNPNRYAEFGDMVANSAGVVLGFYFTVSKARFILQRVEKIILPAN